MNYFQSLTLAQTLASMKLKSEASRLVLSYLWWVIEPMLFVAMFYFVFEVLLGSGRGDFIVFLMVGKIPFLWFIKTINSSANALISGKGIMGQRDFPKHIFPYVVVEENTQKQMVVFLFMVIALIAKGYEPSFHWLYFLLIVAVNFLLMLPLAMLAALVVVYVRDLRMVISLATTFLMFSSGLFWDVRSLEAGAQHLLLTYNPMAFLLDAYRQVLMFSAVPDIAHLGWILLGSLVALFFMHFLYSVQSKFIARKVLS
ncbi:ABC transporter permease [Reinekea marinisedimentorum]|uniref:Transport permease protein n=1 Tax=Reinekea marinisedimentorum TaxID=230495 RepID=A0A4R3IBS3_9GAMM|nr:ABC transporter permease [Reinekea marinisedimentorum]TCS41958.1 lipopolysaccharide transport system permease protein [Reinekea marinisedimentorum]